MRPQPERWAKWIRVARQSCCHSPENPIVDASFCFSSASNQPMQEWTALLSDDPLPRCVGHAPNKCDSACGHKQRRAAQHGMGDHREAGPDSNTEPGAFEDDHAQTQSFQSPPYKKQKPTPHAVSALSERLNFLWAICTVSRYGCQTGPAFCGCWVNGSGLFRGLPAPGGSQNDLQQLCPYIRAVNPETF